MDLNPVGILGWREHANSLPLSQLITTAGNVASSARVAQLLRVLEAIHRVLKMLHRNEPKPFQNPERAEIGMDFQRTIAAFDDILMTPEETD